MEEEIEKIKDWFEENFLREKIVYNSGDFEEKLREFWKKAFDEGKGQSK